MFWKSVNRSSTAIRFYLATSNLARRLYSKAFVIQNTNGCVLENYRL